MTVPYDNPNILAEITPSRPIAYKIREALVPDATADEKHDMVPSARI